MLRCASSGRAGSPRMSSASDPPHARKQVDVRESLPWKRILGGAIAVCDCAYGAVKMLVGRRVECAVERLCPEDAAGLDDVCRPFQLV